MKFTDGQWLVRPGYTIHRPAMAHDFRVERDCLTVYAPCRRIAHRGMTLDGPLLTIRFSSPRPNVIRVRLTHFEGGAPRGPEFSLNEAEGTVVAVAETAADLRLTSGSLQVRVTKDNCAIEFFDDERRLTGSGPGAAAYILAADGAAYLREQLDLGVGECVYGLGERFTPFVKNGQTVEIWNEDGGTASEQAYKNIPFYLTNRGYGVFVNHPEKVSFEIAAERTDKVQFSVAGEYLEYLVINGPSPKEVLSNYTALTGRPALPPAWSFGLWLSTSFTTDYDEETVGRFVAGMAERDLPLSVFHFDCFWMREYHWCDFTWDERIFPDPAGMIARLKQKGLRICVWINPYIAQRSRLFAEGADGGFLLKKPDGDVWQWDRWQAGMGIVDFTNPEARRWYAEHLRKLLAMGVDCFKTDFGERIPLDVAYADGSDPAKMHNYYSYLYNETVFRLLEEELGPGRAVVFARSATTGGQRFPVHWGGDCRATYESMAESLRGGLSLGLSGFGFWSHDIGGFEETATADLYKRWVAFGLFSSHSRLHGSTSYRVPWSFDEESVEVLRFFTKLKCTLMPYLFAAANEAAAKGLPMLRAMMLEFPADPACDYLDRQYMLGGSLLVAPVFNAEGEVDYYLPPGRWTNYLTGEEIEGGSWRRERHGYLSLPLLVRADTILATGARDDRPDYDFADGATYQVFALTDGSRVETTVYDVAGRQAASLRAARAGAMIDLAYRGEAKTWTVLLRGVHSLQSLQGGTYTGDARGLLLRPVDGGREMRVTL